MLRSFQGGIGGEIGVLWEPLTASPAPAVNVQIVTWCDTRDMVPFIQTEIPKRFALRIRLIETLEGWQERSQTSMPFGCRLLREK